MDGKIATATSRRSVAFPAGGTNLVDRMKLGVAEPELPPRGTLSLYRKICDRASFAFALVSVAAALRVEDGVVRDVRIALGGVTHKPWRAPIAEAELLGGPATEEAFRRAAELELAAARLLSNNGSKVSLARGTAATIANAAHHTTGIRVRRLPLTVDHFLT
ncbi:hypothetical protein [Umezawaea tangerina]|uniref:hypothetical protein n=1 Tax=Umezawaea tangerina TaxID=84725 RepID=UPI003CCB7F0C